MQRYDRLHKRHERRAPLVTAGLRNRLAVFCKMRLAEWDRLARDKHAATAAAAKPAARTTMDPSDAAYEPPAIPLTPSDMQRLSSYAMNGPAEGARVAQWVNWNFWEDGPLPPSHPSHPNQAVAKTSARKGPQDPLDAVPVSCGELLQLWGGALPDAAQTPVAGSTMAIEDLVKTIATPHEFESAGPTTEPGSKRGKADRSRGNTTPAATSYDQFDSLPSVVEISLCAQGKFLSAREIEAQVAEGMAPYPPGHTLVCKLDAPLASDAEQLNSVIHNVIGIIEMRAQLPFPGTPSAGTGSGASHARSSAVAKAMKAADRRLAAALGEDMQISVQSDHHTPSKPRSQSGPFQPSPFHGRAISGRAVPSSGPSSPVSGAARSLTYEDTTTPTSVPVADSADLLEESFQSPKGADSSAVAGDSCRTWIWVQVTCRRLVELAELPDSVFLKGNVFPALHVDVRCGTEGEALTELSAMEAALADIVNIKIVLVLGLSSVLPDLSHIMLWVRRHPGLVKLVLLRYQRSQSEIIECMPPSDSRPRPSDGAAARPFVPLRLLAPGRSGPATHSGPQFVAGSQDPMHLLQALERSSRLDYSYHTIQPCDFVPAGIMRAFVRSLEGLGYGLFSVGAASMCGFVCVLVSLDGFKSIPINRLLRFEDLYKHVYPILAAAGGDISSLSPGHLADLWRALNDHVRPEAKRCMPSLAALLRKGADLKGNAWVQQVLGSLQVVAVHNFMDWGGVDAMRRCGCSVVTTATGSRLTGTTSHDAANFSAGNHHRAACLGCC